MDRPHIAAAALQALACVGAVRLKAQRIEGADTQIPLVGLSHELVEVQKGTAKRRLDQHVASGA